MSVQLGVEPPSGPASARLGDRARYRWLRFSTEPNPLWMREMRQSTRLLRTPIILLLLTVLLTLLMSAIGGLMTGSYRPNDIGAALFHTFFSLAYFVVMIVGPALAANSIASERDGRTWEALLLTGMRPEAIARGKVMSAYTAIALYIVMLAPVGALSFLFGGVGPLEVMLAFAMLFVFAVQAVCFGLAVSAKMDSLRAALLVTLLVAMPASAVSFVSFGVGGAQLAHELWPTVDRFPVWYPAALVRAPFDWRYFVFLVLGPAALVGLSTWLFYEITKSNLTSVTDDRSFGLKRWHIATGAALVLLGSIAVVVADSSDISTLAITVMTLFGLFVTSGVSLFQGEELGPSRRVQALLAHAGRLRRSLAPGVLPALRMQALVAFGGLAALLGVSLAVLRAKSPPDAHEQTARVLLFLASWSGTLGFFLGLGAMLRSRATSAGPPRVTLSVVSFLLTAAPWVLAAMTGIFTRGSGAAMAIAAPSPLFVYFVGLPSLAPGKEPALVVATLCAAAVYGALGLGLAFMATTRCRAVIATHASLLADADRRLAAEDAEALMYEAQREAQARAAAADAPEADGDAPA